MTTNGTHPRFGLFPLDRPADEIERQMLDLWDKEDLFQKSLAQNANGEPFVFFEGPPTANGKPGIHHVFSRTIKDLFCRYRAMKGRRVDRKAGWDTHGLPVEIEVEKQLGISGKQEIEALGVAEFNRRCRESVFTYRGDWEKLSRRIAYWLDYSDPYITYSNEYVESVWWALATLYEKGLLYLGYKVVPYCPRCGTALSSHELGQPGAYEDVEDPSVYIALAVRDANGAPTPRRILVWTTTPWTLPSNAALAVHPDIEYVEVESRKPDARGTLILAASRLSAVFGAEHDDKWRVVARFKGADMVGWRYNRPIDWLDYPADTNHEIIVAELFVSEGDGTGVVHMSPAFGADDYSAGIRNNLGFLQPVGSRGEFPDSMPLVGGMFVKDADPILIKELDRRGVLWKSGRLVHSYPHCWRCRTRLLYYARDSWFIRTTEYKDAMLARNARVHWHPAEVGEGRFGDWLATNVDWAVSRERYWGTALPIWRCDHDESHRDIVGSFADLAAHAGHPLPKDFDPHRPHVDSYHWKCSKAGCGGTMRRVTEVIDTWFDSGSMPFAQWHYPFENKDSFDDQYPAEFIAEGVDQTRGWFYSLLAIATGLGDALPHGDHGVAAPYRNVVVNDLVLDADGRKMSKSRGNVVEPWKVIAEYGVDAIRIFLIASSEVSVPRRFDEKVIRELAGRFLLTLENIYNGIFAQYANFGWEPSNRDPDPSARPPIDRWMLSRLGHTEQAVDRALNDYDATAAVRAVIKLVDDDLGHWYVRVNRGRFYDIDSDDNCAAFATLHEVLVSVCRMLAPFAPFVTDWMHRELVGSSVHLARFLPERPRAVDIGLERAVAAVRELVALGRAAREDVSIKVRQPLSRMVCVVPDVPETTLRALIPLLAAELNVKHVDFATSGDSLVTLEAKPNFRSLGKKFGSRTPLAAKAVAGIGSDRLRAFEHGEPLTLSIEGESHELTAEDVTISRRSAGEWAVREAGGYFVGLDPSISSELRAEGRARELISWVQRMRKDAGLAVSDRIVLSVAGPDDARSMLDTHGEWIRAEVLATGLVITGEATKNSGMQTLDLNGVEVGVSLTRTQ